MTTYCVLDTETSGLFDFAKPADAEGQPRMASIAMIYLDEQLNVEREIYTLISPDGWEMDPNSDAAKVNGLTTARLIDEGVPVHAVLEEYTNAVKEGRVFVAHNSQFDLKVIRGELRRAGLPDQFEETKNICTMRGLTDVVKAPKANGAKGWKFPKLSEAVAHFGGTSVEAHNALSDAQDCAFLFRKMVELDLVPEAKVHYAKNKPEPAPMGHNNPPEPMSFEAITQRVDDLFGEAKLWLDGAVVDNEDLAAGVSNLRNSLKQCGADATKVHKVEKEPWLEGGRKVDAKKNAILEKVDLVDRACQLALKPWLLHLEEVRDAEAKRLRDEADAARLAALTTHQAAAATGNLETLQEAEGLIKQAKQAEKVAVKAESSVASVSGGIGRSTKLVSTYSPVLLNFQAALEHYTTTRPAQIREFLETLATADVRSGLHKIPGFTVVEEKKVA